MNHNNRHDPDDNESPGIELLSIQDGFNSQHSHPPSHEQTPERELDEPPPYTPPIRPPQSHLRPGNTAGPDGDILPTYAAAAGAAAAHSRPGLPPPIYKARICGLQRRTFFLLIFAVPALILIIVAGTLGKVLIHDRYNNDNKNISLSLTNTSSPSTSGSSSSLSNDSVPQQTISAAPDGGTFTFKACMTDVVANNSLVQRTFVDSKVVPQTPPFSYMQCAISCQLENFFGTENDGSCYCGNFLTANTQPVNVSFCDPNCSGGFCGAQGFMLVYENVQAVGV